MFIVFIGPALFSRVPVIIIEFIGSSSVSGRSVSNPVPERLIGVGTALNSDFPAVLAERIDCVVQY
jgi:hypothetical protein